jgi:uncharacterized protein YkwD
MTFRRIRAPALALGLVAALGCPADETGTKPTRTPDGRVRGIKLVKQKASPNEKPATRYGAPVAYQLTEVEKVLAETVGRTGLHHDAAVSAMAHELARTSPDHLNIPPALVDGLLAWFGLVDPPPRLIVVEIPNDHSGCAEQVADACAEPIQALVDEVAKSSEADRHSRFGVGAVALESGNSRLMVAIVNRMVGLEEVPVTLAVDGKLELKGQLLGGRADPRLEVIDPKGHWQSVPTVSGTDGSFQGLVKCDRGQGVYQVELLATGQHGPEVTANFPLYCGVARKASIDFETEQISGAVTAADVARANFEYLNQARVVRGLPPLTWDDRAAQIALDHSRDMYESGFVGHVSPSTGDVTQRFARAKVQGSVIRENVARGYGPKGMHESLMSSPGHRVNIVAEDVTNVGIGVVIGKAETAASGAPRPMFLTQNFYKKPGSGAPKDLPKATREQVDAVRDKAGLPPLQWDAQLARLAQRKADAQAKGRPGMADAEFQERVFGLGFASLARHEVSAGDHTALSTIDVWRQLTAQQYVGIGVARIPEARGQRAGFLLIIAVTEK